MKCRSENARVIQRNEPPREHVLPVVQAGASFAPSLLVRLKAEVNLYLSGPRCCWMKTDVRLQ